MLCCLGTTSQHILHMQPEDRNSQMVHLRSKKEEIACKSKQVREEVQMGEIGQNIETQKKENMALDDINTKSQLGLSVGQDCDQSNISHDSIEIKKVVEGGERPVEDASEALNFDDWVKEQKRIREIEGN
ncbi:hypothetical protein ACROYT_G013881 [Oculina patagonica]